MKRYLFLNLSLLIAFSSHGIEMSECISQAAQYGVDMAAPRIDEGCKQLIINSARDRATARSSDNYIQAFAAENMVHVVQYENDESGNPVIKLSGLTSGRFTGFENIVAIDIDEVGSKIYALNESADGTKSVLAVDAHKAGALAANVKLYSDEVSNAVNIKADRTNGDLYVAGSDWIKNFQYRCPSQGKQTGNVY